LNLWSALRLKLIGCQFCTEALKLDIVAIDMSERHAVAMLDEVTAGMRSVLQCFGKRREVMCSS
jgi:hypothetical protein